MEITFFKLVEQEGKIFAEEKHYPQLFAASPQAGPGLNNPPIVGLPAASPFVLRSKTRRKVSHSVSGHSMVFKSDPGCSRILQGDAGCSMIIHDVSGCSSEL